MGGVWVGVTQEVGEGDGGEGVGVVVGRFVEFHHLAGMACFGFDGCEIGW